MDKLTEIKNQLKSAMDDIDNMLEQLINLKTSYRGPGTTQIFNKKATSEINRYLNNITDETKIPKS